MMKQFTYGKAIRWVKPCNGFFRWGYDSLGTIVMLGRAGTRQEAITRATAATEKYNAVIRESDGCKIKNRKPRK